VPGISGWIVYSRPGCGLCEEFMYELAALLGEQAAVVQVVDIDGDLELTRKYFDRIPVLTVDDDFVCAYRLDVERVRRYL
jgi:Glutaredoxin-like domain (DUF836)